MLRRLFLDQLVSLPALALGLIAALPRSRPAAERRPSALDLLEDLEARTPVSMSFVIDGTTYQVIRWSELQWRDLPEEARPDDDDVMQDSSNGAFVLRRVADDCPLEDLSPDAAMAAVLELEVARREMDVAEERLEFAERTSAPPEHLAYLERCYVDAPRKRVADALRRCRRLGAGEWYDMRA